MDIFSFLPSFLLTTPLLLIWVVGIVLAAMRRPQHRAQSRLLIAAFILLIVAHLVGYSSTPMTFLLLDALSPAQIGVITLGISVFTILLNLGSWIMILVAIFGNIESNLKTTAGAAPNTINHST